MSAFWLKPLVMTLWMSDEVDSDCDVSECFLSVVLMAVGLPLMLTRNSYLVLLTILILCPLLLECTP